MMFWDPKVKTSIMNRDKGMSKVVFKLMTHIFKRFIVSFGKNYKYNSLSAYFLIFEPV